jgi:phenylalanyl-tRNA synthetase alpha chain
MDLEAIRDAALAAIGEAPDEKALQDLRVRYLGRKSELVAALRGLGKLPREERAEVGARTNRVKQAVEEALDQRAAALRGTKESSLADTEWLDLSLPAEHPRRGHLHPISQVENDLDYLFRGWGTASWRAPGSRTRGTTSTP